MTVATALLWVSLLAGAGVMVYAMQQPDPRDPYRVRDLLMVIILVWYALLAVVIFFIRAGHNWARIVWFFTVVMGVTLLFIEFFVYPSDRRLIPNWVWTVRFAAESVAMYLIFTKPGTLWFLPRKPAEEAAAPYPPASA